MAQSGPGEEEEEEGAEPVSVPVDRRKAVASGSGGAWNVTALLFFIALPVTGLV
jgi:hypothetical protein